MKKLMFLFLVISIIGCGSYIKSVNGSFKNSLKPEYYEKKTYNCFLVRQQVVSYTVGTILGGGIAGPALGGMVGSFLHYNMNKLTVEDAIQIGSEMAYNSFSMIQCEQISELSQKGSPLWIKVNPMYKKDEIVGCKIDVTENKHGQTYKNYYNYREITKNEKGQLVISRENISEDEANLEEIRHDVRRDETDSEML